MYLGIALLCLTHVRGYFCVEDIHRYMSREEVQQVFHTDVDSVPEYEIVTIQLSDRLHKRALPSGSRLHMRAFGEDVNLWLHPGDSILAGVDTPVYYAKRLLSNTERVTYRREDGLMGMVGKLFEDKLHVASLVIGTDESGDPKINGFIGSKKLVVRSLPERVTEEYRRRRRSIADHEEPTPHHIVFKNTDDDIVQDHASEPILDKMLLLDTMAKTSKIPEVLYPEILVVVEHSVYEAQGSDILGLLQYILAFWNGVDLKYRSLESPRFRFHISGVVISENPEATPYVSDHMLDVDAFNSTRAMTDATLFYYAVQDSLPLEDYDIAVTMTRLNLGVNGSASILGVARIGSACKKNNFYKMMDSHSIFRDNGAFQGVHVIAHELGHLLGAGHDMETENCMFSDGFLMSFTPWYTTNTSDFSTCSMEQIQKQLHFNHLKCLYNEPRSSGKALPRLMPGRVKTLDEQCKAKNRVAHCEPKRKSENTSVCVNFWCTDSHGVCYETSAAAVDGTKCEGENNFCLHQQCIGLD